jgi:hypothetical protein
MLTGDLYMGLDIPVKAVQLYQAAIKAPQTPSRVLKISQACAMAHDRDKAPEWIEKGLAIAPDIRLLELKAWILSCQKKYARSADRVDQPTGLQAAQKIEKETQYANKLPEN